jgi:hypothetical protein
VIPTVFELGRLFGGWFLQPEDVDALSFVKYTYVAIALNKLTGLDLHCETSELKSGKCPITNGDQIIKSKGYDAYTIANAVAHLSLFSSAHALSPTLHYATSSGDVREVLLAPSVD